MGLNKSIFKHITENVKLYTVIILNCSKVNVQMFSYQSKCCVMKYGEVLFWKIYALLILILFNTFWNILKIHKYYLTVGIDHSVLYIYIYICYLVYISICFSMSRNEIIRRGLGSFPTANLEKHYKTFFYFKSK